jgi:hypothetical protein
MKPGADTTTRSHLLVHNIVYSFINRLIMKYYASNTSSFKLIMDSQLLFILVMETMYLVFLFNSEF